MKILYANETDFEKYADPDNPRRPLVAGGVFRNANRWDGCAEVAEEVLIVEGCNAASEIAEAYEGFSWKVPGKYPGTTREVRAKITILNSEKTKEKRDQKSRGGKSAASDGDGDQA